MKVLKLRLLEKLFYAMGYETLFLKAKRKKIKTKSLNLNIGAGKYTIPNFVSLDYFSPHYYKSQKNFSSSRVAYDIRNDSIPYKDAEVDNIYISHVVEHIEDFAVLKFFEEAFRVLKKNGVLRVACPDAKFLYQVSQFDNDYYDWYKSINRAKAPRQYDFLVNLISSPRGRCNNNNITEEIMDIEELKKMDYANLTSTLKNNLSFRSEFPGEHINNWDFERLQAIGKKVGFTHVFESKYLGSVSKEMQSLKFDKTHPEMSLYVEFVK